MLNQGRGKALIAIRNCIKTVPNWTSQCGLLHTSTVSDRKDSHRIFLNKNQYCKHGTLKYISTATMNLKMNEDAVNHQLTNYFKDVGFIRELPSQLNSPVRESAEPSNSSEWESLITRYLMMIATDPLIDKENILKFYYLYDVSKRPMIEDKSQYPNEFNKLLYVTQSCMKSLSFDEIKQLSLSLLNLQLQKLSVIDKLVYSLAEECAARVSNCSLADGLMYFEVLLHIYKSGIGKRAIYKVFTEHFFSHLNSANDTELIKILYYSTIRHMNAEKQVIPEVLKRLKTPLQEMPFVISGVVASSMQKGILQQNSHDSFLSQLEAALNIRLLSSNVLSPLEEFSLVSIVNVFRLTGYETVSLTSSLEKLVLEHDPEQLNFETIPCLLAYFANKVYNKDVFNKLEQRIITLLLQDNTILVIPAYARILWSFSHASHNVSHKFKDIMIDHLKSFLLTGKAGRSVLKYVDALMSLAIMGYSDRSILQEIFVPTHWKKLPGTYIRLTVSNSFIVVFCLFCIEVHVTRCKFDLLSMSFSKLY